MTTGSVLAQVRKQLMSVGGEVTALSEPGAVQELWGQIQNLKLEMNQAKKEAAEEAAKPYLEAIGKIERRYAMFLKLQN